MVIGEDKKYDKGTEQKEQDKNSLQYNAYKIDRHRT